VNYPKPFAIACLCWLLITVGCIYGPVSERPEDRSASAEVDISESSHTGEAILLTGNVTLNAMGYNITLEDVALVFVAENGSTIRTITVGQMSGDSGEWHDTDREEFNVSVSTPPTQLRLRIGTVNKPDVAPFVVAGQRLKDEDNLSYTSFSQNEY